MKKRALAGGIALFLAFAVSLASFFVVREKGNTLVRLSVQTLSAEPGDDHADVVKLLSFWENNRKLFFALLKHSDADALSLSFDRLSTAFAEEDVGELQALVAEILAEMRVILEGETPGVGNIF